MANPPGPVFIGLDGYFILIFLQKSGYMSNEIDSSMKLLPYVDDKFVGYRNKSVQDFRFALSEGIRSQVFFATFVEKVENQIKSISVINASKLFLHRSGYASSKFKNNFHE